MYSKSFVSSGVLLLAAACGISASGQVQDEEAMPEATTTAPTRCFKIPPSLAAAIP